MVKAESLVEVLRKNNVLCAENKEEKGEIKINRGELLNNLFR